MPRQALATFMPEHVSYMKLRTSRYIVVAAKFHEALVIPLLETRIRQRTDVSGMLLFLFFYYWRQVSRYQSVTDLKTVLRDNRQIFLAQYP